MITQQTKDKYVALAKEHRAADRIIQRTYWENGKGCAVGCMAQTEDEPHKKLAELTGVAEWLLRLQDTTFEGLENKETVNFVVDFWAALPVDTDLEPVKYKFLSWLQEENVKRVESLEGLDSDLKEKVLTAIKQVKAWLDDPNRTESAAESARSAESAAESAAWAAESAARSEAWAAESAAWSAESAARSAAWAAESAARSAESAAWAARSAAWAAESAARSAESAAWAAESAAWAEAWAVESARSAAWAEARDKLLELLRDAE